MTLHHPDPMGVAIADYWKERRAARLRVFSPDFDEDEIPVSTLFRTWEEMPPLEQQALSLVTGKVLDVGAGAGCHSLVLQARGVEVHAIDLSELGVQTMRERGVREARVQNFWQVTERYDTVLMLMNGIGIVGRIAALPTFFQHLDQLLTPAGQVLLDSSDLRYLYEDEDGTFDWDETDGYYGELTYSMQYRNVKGASFPWLYLDFPTLERIARAHGFCAELLAEGEHYDYLARLRRVAE